MAGQRIPAAMWHERVAQWRSSGLPAPEYAKQHGLRLERFTYWARRSAREATSKLLPIRVRERATPVDALELRSPSGWTMRINSAVDPAWLAAVLSGLR